jgi:endonuclease/exonuclease/phosphatase family metal-dependent hydrolase
MRLDRIILDGANGRFTAKSIDMFANTPIPGIPDAPYAFASDHFGLRAEIRMSADSRL